MKLGINWPPEPLQDHEPLVRATEATGVDLIGVSDSQAGEYRECYVTLSRMVAETSRVTVGPMVTNPITRHPAVTAAALSTIAEAAPGRCIVGISTGDSGVHNLGLRPAKLRELEDYVSALRGLFTGAETSYRGATMRLRWAHQRIPIYIGAEGPRSLRLAGRIADGVIVGGGLSPEVIDAALALIEDGAASAGRDLGDLEVWFMGKASLAKSREAALHDVRASLASSANHVFRFTLEGKAVPAELVPAIERLQQRYDVQFHNVPGEENPNAKLIEELELTDYLARRFGILGTPADCIEQLAAIKARPEVDGVLARPLVEDQIAFLRNWREVVNGVAAA